MPNKAVFSVILVKNRVKFPQIKSQGNPAPCRTRFFSKIGSLQVAGRFCPRRLPPCKLRDAFVGEHWLPASCRTLLSTKITSLQVAGRFCRRTLASCTKNPSNLPRREISSSALGFIAWRISVTQRYWKQVCHDFWVRLQQKEFRFVNIPNDPKPLR